MSVEGFILHKKIFRTKHNIYQLRCYDDKRFDFETAVALVKQLGDHLEHAANGKGYLCTLVPPGYRWEVVK